MYSNTGEEYRALFLNMFVVNLFLWEYNVCINLMVKEKGSLAKKASLQYVGLYSRCGTTMVCQKSQKIWELVKISSTEIRAIETCD